MSKPTLFSIQDKKKKKKKNPLHTNNNEGLTTKCIYNAFFSKYLYNSQRFPLKLNFIYIVEIFLII
jgi:hypothetical protein